MKKILITGFSGFVAHHFLQFLYDGNIQMDVYGVDITAPQYDLKKYNDRIRINFERLDLLNKEEVYTYLNRIRPDYILHLAAFSSVAYSWDKPCESFANNTNLFLNIISGIRDQGITTRVLSVGSSEEYGNVEADRMPLRETDMVSPVSPYAVARVSQEMLSKVFAESCGMDIVLTRSFNHIGLWQDERFVVPSFVKRIHEIVLSGKKSGEIETGDVSIIRDFVDVRDVVRAYYELLDKGVSGEVYNVCSGIGTSLQEILDIIAKSFGVKATVKVNPKYIRPNDNHVIIGSYEKLFNETGWRPEYNITDTIKDIIDHVTGNTIDEGK